MRINNLDLSKERAAAGEQYLSKIREAARHLERAGAVANVRRAGDLAPDFALADPSGSLVGLSHELRSGPVVISFYRGEWCPFCGAELAALLAAQPAMAALGATLLLISPERPSVALREMVAAQGRRARLLHDGMLGVALQYGLVYLVPDELREYYLDKDFDLTRFGSGSWLLPLPADFIVRPDRRIELAYVDADFSVRLDPKLLVHTLSRLRP
jgi:peroxiredoxin